MNGTNILLLLRDKIANDWASLCREFKRDPESLATDTMTQILHQQLEELRKLGLIKFDDDPNSLGGIGGQIQILEHWTSIHRALGGQSLKDLAKLDREHSMIVNPFFGRPNKLANPTDLFVLMPFQTNLRPVYNDHIKNVASSLGLTVARADDLFTAHTVMSDIWAAVCASRAVVADCTGRNPNVFYEIGLAHVIGKPVILITQNSDDVPFDIKHLRYIPYEYTPRGMDLFEQSLAATLKTELGL